MENQSKHIDDLFREELGGYAETPPPMAWDALEKRLEGAPPKGVGVVLPSGRKSVYLGLAGLALVLSLSVTRKMIYTPGSSPVAAASVDANLPALKQGTATPLPQSAATPATGATLSPATNAAQPSSRLAAGISNPIAGNTKNNNTKNSTKQHKNTPVNKNHNRTGAYASAGSKTKITARSGETNDQENETDQQQLIPNSSSDTAQADLPPAENKTVATTAAKNKQDSVRKRIAANAQKKKDDKIAEFHRFEAGVKAGFETGFDNDAARKLVVSPYLQYNISGKFAIMLQPAVKQAKLQTRRIGDAGSYYKVNNDGSIKATTDSILVAPGQQWLWRYSYSQSHDSIVKTHTMGGTYVEFEVPVLLKYNLSKTFSVYGGPNIVYSKLMGITEQTYTQKNILKTYNDPEYVGLSPIGGTAPAAPYTVSQEITYTGNEISGYKNPYPAINGGMLRVGYMLGFTYEYDKRWLLDGLLEQTPTAANYQSGYNINSTLSAPYFRLTIGYKLIK